MLSSLNVIWLEQIYTLSSFEFRSVLSQHLAEKRKLQKLFTHHQKQGSQAFCPYLTPAVAGA